MAAGMILDRGSLFPDLLSLVVQLKKQTNKQTKTHFDSAMT